MENVTKVKKTFSKFASVVPFILKFGKSIYNFNFQFLENGTNVKDQCIYIFIENCFQHKFYGNGNMIAAHVNWYDSPLNSKKISITLFLFNLWPLYAEHLRKNWLYFQLICYIHLHSSKQCMIVCDIVNRENLNCHYNVPISISIMFLCMCIACAIYN